jgi:hypothetical protein
MRGEALLLDLEKGDGAGELSYRERGDGFRLVRSASWRCWRSNASLSLSLTTRAIATEPIAIATAAASPIRKGKRIAIEVGRVRALGQFWQGPFAAGGSR